MKLAIFASLLAGAAAFAPSSQQTTKSTTVLKASKFANEIGAQAPLGFFDPLKLTDGMEQDDFDRLRYVELKHGRIAMLAVVGNLVTLSGVRFPGMLSSDVAFADLPSGIAGLNAMPAAGLVQILLFIFCMEVGTSTLEGEFKGDFTGTPGQPDFGWSKQSDEWKTKKRTIELNNGRAAQMGILGLMVHEQLGNLNELVYL